MIFVRRFFLFAGFIVLSVSSYSQDTETESEPEKPNTQYVGIQVNQLMRQLLSFGAAGAVNNPYVITWAVNSNTTGWGFATGFGYVFNQIKSGDVISQINTTINDFHFRMGPEKKSKLGKHWITGIGGDIVADSERNKTVASGQGSPSVTSETNSSKFGFGLRVSINYQFSDRLLLGTEGSYYLKMIKEERKFSGQQSINPTSNNLTSFTPTLPAVIYLVFKF